MKQRITLLVSDPHATHPDNFVIEPTRLQIKKSLHTAREDRLTIGYDELPTELWNALTECSEVFIRWSTNSPYESIDPYGSRVPAGLHVYVKPQRETVPSICGLINTAFGLDDCKSFEDSFIEIPGAYLFYSPLSSISAFQSHIESLLCAADNTDCKARIGSVTSADYIDLKYDSISQTLVANSFWSQQPVESLQDQQGENIQATAEHQNIEVGVLGNDRPMGAESLTMGGILHVVGKEDKLEPVMFTFPSRHFRSPVSSYRLKAVAPTGLHPNLLLSISPAPKAPAEDCTLNAYFVLPRELFVDKYQLSSTNLQLLESLGVKRLRGVDGEADLEAPVWGSERWGSTVLVEVDTKQHLTEVGLSVGLPLHLRYLEPQLHNSTQSVRFALPSVFWACRSEEWSQMGNNPFDRLHLGWEHMFPEQTMYYHLSPAEDGWKTVEVPILDLQHAMMIKVGTVAAILGGFLWVAWKITAAFTAGKGGEESVKKKDQ